MQLKLRRLRLFPVLALTFGAYLFYTSLHRPDFRTAPGGLAPNGEKAGEKNVFTRFRAGLFADSLGGNSLKTFHLLPHEKDRGVYARVEFRLREGAQAGLRFAWYLQNDLFMEEERALGQNDTLATVRCTVPRSRAGYFSLDILLSDGTLLETLPFDVVATGSPTPYKSLRNRN